MHVLPMRFSILCTQSGSSDKTQIMCFTILLRLFTSKYDINGSRLNYSTVSSNKFKYINTQLICKDKTKSDKCCSQNTSRIRLGICIYKTSLLIHGRPQGGAKRAFAPLEIGTKKQIFLENVKSGI